LPASLIQRARLLPYHGTVKVKEGDWVHATDVVAELDYVPGVLAKVPAAGPLKIRPEALTLHMERAIGEWVGEGEPLASSFLFGEPRCALSTASGYIGLVSNSLGTVYIRQPVPVGGNEPAVIDLLQELEVSKLGLISALRVRPGKMVTPGQVLAARQGLRPKAVLSPIYGKVESIRDGVITIVPTHARTTLHAYVTGRVLRVIPRQGVVIQALAHVVTGVYGVGSESGGEILLAAEADQVLTPEAVTPEWEGKIVVAGRTASLDLLQAADEVGCAGVVVAHMSATNLAAYAGGNSRPGIGGEDEMLMPLMLTERFSPTPMRNEIWHELARLQGRYASMSGKTQIRAGLVRPEVVVCEDVLPAAAAKDGEASGKILVGDLVRVIRSPHLDRIGRVVALPRERQTIVTGSRVRVAEVAIGEELITLPVSNLTKLQEGGNG